MYYGSAAVKFKYIVLLMFLPFVRRLRGIIAIVLILCIQDFYTKHSFSSVTLSLMCSCFKPSYYFLDN